MRGCGGKKEEGKEEKLETKFQYLVRDCINETAHYLSTFNPCHCPLLVHAGVYRRAAGAGAGAGAALRPVNVGMGGGSAGAKA